MRKHRLLNEVTHVQSRCDTQSFLGSVAQQILEQTTSESTRRVERELAHRSEWLEGDCQISSVRRANCPTLGELWTADTQAHFRQACSRNRICRGTGLVDTRSRASESCSCPRGCYGFSSAETTGTSPQDARRNSCPNTNLETGNGEVAKQPFWLLHCERCRRQWGHSVGQSVY